MRALGLLSTAISYSIRFCIPSDNLMSRSSSRATWPKQVGQRLYRQLAVSRRPCGAYSGRRLRAWSRNRSRLKNPVRRCHSRWPVRSGQQFTVHNPLSTTVSEIPACFAPAQDKGRAKDCCLPSWNFDLVMYRAEVLQIHRIRCG
jgi:hypothetical protein